jgi:hypothetical protein
VREHATGPPQQPPRGYREDHQDSVSGRRWAALADPGRSVCVLPKPGDTRFPPQGRSDPSSRLSPTNSRVLHSPTLFDPAPSPKKTRFALNAGNEHPTPTRSYVCPANPIRVTRPFKYYHNTSSIGRGNRQLPLSGARIGSAKPKPQHRQPETHGNVNCALGVIKRPGATPAPGSLPLPAVSGSGACTTKASRHQPQPFDAPERIRTSDLRFRRPTLYPAELRAQGRGVYRGYPGPR